MALSNWDTLAFGPDGKTCAGHFESEKHKGVILDIYKNWCHIADEQAWREGGSFSKPYVMSFTQGEFAYGPLTIKAKRHEGQNAIFVMATEYIYEKDKPTRYRFFAGIGCYGFKSQVKIQLERLGRLDELHKFDWHTSTLSEPDGKGGRKRTCSLLKCELGTFKPIEEIPVPEIDLDELWEGVSADTLKAFHAWLDELAAENKSFEAWVAKVKKSKPLSFNQGDAYFAKALGFKTPKSKVGKKRPRTVMSKILKKKAKPQLKNK